jgi:hypothetical protein
MLEFELELAGWSRPLCLLLTNLPIAVERNHYLPHVRVSHPFWPTYGAYFQVYIILLWVYSLWDSCPGVMGLRAITEPRFYTDLTKEQGEGFIARCKKKSLVTYRGCLMSHCCTQDGVLEMWSPRPAQTPWPESASELYRPSDRRF